MNGPVRCRRLQRDGHLTGASKALIRHLEQELDEREWLGSRALQARALMLRALGCDGANRYAPLFLQIVRATTVEELWAVRDELATATSILNGQAWSDRLLEDITSVLIGA